MPAVLILLAALGAADGATQAIRARDAEIRAALPPPGTAVTPAIRKRIEAIVTRAIDVHAMVQASLGERWRQMSESQRRRIVNAFQERFRRTSSSELDTYRSTRIDYRPEVELDDGTVQVPTRLVVKGEPTDITYTLRRERGSWHIIDIVVDGVSTVANYRSSFARIIRKEGVEGLIRRLERGGSPKKS
jgi:phospholipid transport system substrate-binding protein